MIDKCRVQSEKRKVKAKSLKFLVFSFSLFALSFALTCFAQSVSSSELINNAKQYDGKIVGYQGEAIGDIMTRGDYAWVNVNDGDNAIGIWVSAALAKKISLTGGYKSRGDKIEISGIFHRACLEHGGDLDIHAQSIGIIEPGRLIAEKLNTSKRNFALILLSILAIIWILSRLSSR